MNSNTTIKVGSLVTTTNNEGTKIIFIVDSIRRNGDKIELHCGGKAILIPPNSIWMYHSDYFLNYTHDYLEDVRLINQEEFEVWMEFYPEIIKDVI